ncbi:hypothetical protein ACRE_041980 [Hapsidospora chrysogenum ATCC 11550]|uniref:Uncharacterized protein n=1 Tax=Hapsidospora chrysogenum (strain ATCC 11550 / CBS 779.69 / DSM 880 / IAM 14645 / JCM 23072 / IMI 49137) TaxID=857340 RepID=A0A086T6K4_HAPC1|nr:hypothetical protein ACRE_041980 [Hapsidospora chrysogenum ATCC 11550]
MQATNCDCIHTKTWVDVTVARLVQSGGFQQASVAAGGGSSGTQALDTGSWHAECSRWRGELELSGALGAMGQ